MQEKSSKGKGVEKSSSDIPKTVPPKGARPKHREFKITVVGVKKHKWKYCFKCGICDYKSHSVREWNLHHMPMWDRNWSVRTVEKTFGAKHTKGP